MADLPAGATFGSLVHGVLEHADPFADDFPAELATHREQLAWWPVDARRRGLAEALVPSATTPLGALAPDWTLRGGSACPTGSASSTSRCRWPAATRRTGRPSGSRTWRAAARHLPAGDPLRAVRRPPLGAGLGEQCLRGYLTGSIDVVLRVPTATAPATTWSTTRPTGSATRTSR